MPKARKPNSSAVENVLVTGGAGYIGAHACKALAANGFMPIAYDNLVSGHEWAVRWGPLARGDLLDLARLDEVFRQYKPSAVMHFAAHADVAESVAQPSKYYQNNIAGTLNLLETMGKHGVNRMVFSSTCATYGIPQTLPISELHPQNPINPYGASKLMIERIMSDFSAAYGLRSIALRYFNAAGADPEGQIGEEHDPETHLIPLVLAAADGSRPHITINGTDYATPDGTCIRDYIHVTDIATVHVLALRSLEAGLRLASCNLGNGKGFSVREVIRTAGLVTGRKIVVKEGPRRPGDPARLVADATRATNQLGWKPQYEGLKQIIETAWNWVRQDHLALAPTNRAIRHGPMVS